VSDERQRLGSSGIFKVIVDGAKKLKRAVSDDEPELTPEANEVAVAIGQAFIAGRFGDVYALGVQGLQKRNTSREVFESRWRATIGDRTLTSFSITDAGFIELAFIPGLEDTSQDDFIGMAEITFSTPEVGLEDEKAFAVAAVLLAQGGRIMLGAIHAR